MNIDRTTHATRIELSVSEALEMIEKLAADVRHAERFNYCAVSMPVIYSDVEGEHHPGSIILVVKK